MATLEIVHGAPAASPGATVVRSNNPSALAAVPDVLSRELAQPEDLATFWAVHPSEQTGLRESAYADERAELGPNARVQVVELLRPRERNVVWIDRYHLVGVFTPVSLAARLLGLYVSGEGAILLYVHPPEALPNLSQLVDEAPRTGATNWSLPPVVEQARFALRYDSRRGPQLELASPTRLQPQLTAALHQLSTVVAAW